jgi:hypothetical protein
MDLWILSHIKDSSNKIIIKIEIIENNHSKDQDIIDQILRSNKKNKNPNNKLFIIKIQEHIGKIKAMNILKKETIKMH